MPSFRAVHLIGSRQLEVSNSTSRTRKVNVYDVHKTVLSDHIISSIPDGQVFGRKEKYINDPRILKEVSIIEAFYIKIFYKSGSDKSKTVSTQPLNFSITPVHCSQHSCVPIMYHFVTLNYILSSFLAY